MKFSEFFIPTAKESPKDAVIRSHVLMVRAGLVKKLGSGIYSLLPLGYRVVKKVENIIREEMDGIGCSEFSLPILIPGELWKTSGRWEAMGPELFRLKDRNEQDFVLAPTHEEAFTFLLREHIKSYRDLPLRVYHIGFKFRDEIRPRFGVMRGKSFIMKDAYSFHGEGDEESLERAYGDMATAYRRIFERCGLNTVPVSADSGSMGGSLSEEFMVPSHVGEEEIIQCGSCGYIANREKAASKQEEISYTDGGALELVHTPGVKTIAQLSEFLKVPPDHLIKTLVFKADDGRFVCALIRGDLDINEAKLKNLLGAGDLTPAEPDESEQKLGIPLGFAGPIRVDSATVVADLSVRDIRGGVTGANRKDYHYRNVNAGRDFSPSEFADLRLTVEGDRCPRCGEPLRMFKGIELGHIFKLGDKYTRAFEVTYLDEDGVQKTPIMGCYGIGVERTIAAVIEQNHQIRRPGEGGRGPARAGAAGERDRAHPRRPGGAGGGEVHGCGFDRHTLSHHRGRGRIEKGMRRAFGAQKRREGVSSG
jgi:prolyl-tRNA synthetase